MNSFCGFTSKVVAVGMSRSCGRRVYNPLGAPQPVKELILAYRVPLGFAFFLVLGVHDWLAHRESPKRAKEYLYLLYGMTLAIIYGVAHDHVTATISPYYFLVGKELELDPRPFRWAVTVLAA